jgi:hypothetical protein
VVTKYVWIGIAVGVFFAGVGIGYAIFQSTVAPGGFAQMTPQQMQQMMNNPNFRQQMMNQWMQNPQMMQNWMGPMMSDPQLSQQMLNSMMQNQQFMRNMMQDPQFSNMMMTHMRQNPMMMQNWLGPMMNDPQLRQQMYGNMFQHQQFMQEMMNNPQFQQNWMGTMMGQGMMGTGPMMGSGMMGGMMGLPISKQSDVLSTINNIEKLLDQVSSSYRAGDSTTAFAIATNAYLENYEYIEGAIAQKDGSLMEKIEIMMRVDLRSMISKGASADDVDAKIDSIKSELGKVKMLFQ